MTKWFIRNAANKFLATGGFGLLGPHTIGWVERYQDATPFDTKAQALDVAVWLSIPDALEIVDYFEHPPLPADADTSQPETPEQRHVRVQAEEAARFKVRKSWGIKAAGAALLAFALLNPASVDAHKRNHHAVRRHHRVLAFHGARDSGVSPLASLFGFVASGTSNAATFAERFVGAGPRELGLRPYLWCADFVNLVERKLGRPGTGSRVAKSFLHYGATVKRPRPGDIVVFHRRGGGHVGYYVSGPASHPVTVSGNAGGNRVRVGRTPLPVIAIVRPQ